MSARRWELVVALQADQDLEDILLYSAYTWGPDQISHYADVLDRTFEQIRRFPESGRVVHDPPPQIRSRRAGQHLVYYSIAEQRGVVTVVRILHQRQQFDVNRIWTDAS